VEIITPDEESNMKDVDGAKEYFKRLKLAEKFCNGDSEIAKQMLNGDFHDMIAVKARFKNHDGEYYGQLLLFINRLTNSITRNYSIISQYASIYQNKPLNHWEIFLDNLEREIEHAEFDEDKTNQINNGIKRFMEITGIKSLIKWIDENDIIEITEKFKEIIDQILDVDDIDIMVDFEGTTSIQLHDKIKLSPDEIK